jgi:signal transduction histidine kinase
MPANAVASRPRPSTATMPPARLAQPEDPAVNLSGPNGLELVVEMAHDLRSPLTAIMFLTETMQDQQHGPVNDRQRHALGLIYSAALGLCTAASDVLELARGGARLTDHDVVPFSISELFTCVRGMILPLAEEKGLTVNLVHPVPERRLGHSRALSRVILNLATNAAKYTDVGTVEIAARPLTPTVLEFSVRDTGRGLDAGDLATLCQPFRKLPTQAQHHFSSAGLGLAICHKLVRAMGSELQVETCGEGTRFFFALDVPPATAHA